MTSRSRAVFVLLAVLPLFCGVASAQQAAPTEPAHRVFVIANMTLAAPNEGKFTSSARQTIAPYTGYSFTYQVPMPFGGEVGGGLLITPFVGLGVDVAHAWSNGNPAVSVRGDVSADQLGRTPLRRSETAAHIQFVVRPKTSADSQLLVYGGPTYFTVHQALINAVFISGAAIDGYSSAEETAKAWGFNLGADMAYFPHPNAGLGITLRYSRATVQLRDSASAFLGQDATQPVIAGGFVFGFGLRLRF